jgi:hypothetical protein
VQLVELVGIGQAAGPPGDEEDGDPGVAVVNPQGELGPRQVRQADVEDDEVGHPVVADQLEGLRRGVRDHAGEPGLLQLAAGGPGDQGLVFHDQDVRRHVNASRGGISLRGPSGGPPTPAG